MLLAILLGIFVTRGISRSLNKTSMQLNDGAEQVADAAAQVAASSQGSFAGQILLGHRGSRAATPVKTRWISCYS